MPITRTTGNTALGNRGDLLEGDAAHWERLAMRLKNGASLVDPVVAPALLATLLFVIYSHAQTSAPVALPVQPPPAKYDHPYAGDVAIYYDLDPQGEFWGWTDVSQIKKGICTIHFKPRMTVDAGAVLDETAFTQLLRHENAHCNGWRHHKE